MKIVSIPHSGSVLIFLWLGLIAQAGEPTAPLFAPGDQTQRLATLTHELAGIDANTMAQWIARIDRSPPCAARDDDRSLVVEFWAAADAKTALAYVESFDTTVRQKLALKASLVRGWTRANPDAAIAWSEKQPLRSELDLTEVAMETLAEINPDQGMRWLRQFAGRPAGDEQDSVYSERAFSFFKKLIDLGDYETCRRAVEDYPTGEVRNQLLFFVADRMAAFVPTDTARWAASRIGQADALYPLAAVVAQKSRRNVVEALNWVLALEDTQLRAKLVRIAAGEAIDREPTLPVVEKILSRLKTPAERDAAYAAFASSEELVRLAPRQIMDWAMAIASDEERRAAIVSGYSLWYGFAAEEAMRHLRGARQLSAADRAAVENYLELPAEKP